MITREQFFGGARLVTLAAEASQRIHPSVAKLWCVNATGADALVSLPKPGDLVLASLGRPILAVQNIGLTRSFVIEDANGDALETVAVDEMAVICLLNFDQPAGTWSIHKHQVS